MKKILVVDDDESIRGALCKVLASEGYEVELAEDGRQAIEKMIQGAIDLLLLDLGLPVKDGWTALQWLSEVNPLLPVIIITGRWRQAGVAAAAGADVLMEKPLDVPALLRHVHELLEEPPEIRARRIRDRRRQFHYEHCDSVQFSEHVQKAYSTPFPSGGVKESS